MIEVDIVRQAVTPRFDEILLNTTIDESAPIDHVIVQINASLAPQDEFLRYRLVQGVLAGKYFQVSGKDGRVMKR